MSRVRLPYPWFSLLGGLAIVIWQLLIMRPDWIEPYTLSETMRGDDTLLAAIGIWLLLLLFESYRFLRARRSYREELNQHEEQIAELFESRRELGTRARTYSSHAEKLKLFISDKLLEYIEYDEKFLHFKNIASEVRHNGVISYDRAQTALKQASEICAGQLDDREQEAQFEEASESLSYLWDLLDIATTDNIALHVANRIYDCEEYYFQSQLNKTDPRDSPYTPIFSMYSALQKALLPVVEDPRAFALADLQSYPLSHSERRFRLLVEGDCDMLGNRNHMVLLLENLINNALYYADQSSSKTRYNRVTILQTLQVDQVIIVVYNRGPRIKEEDRGRIFQLGYSSRRIRDHHGKGLGLYFVNEICKGFEGAIDFENVENRARKLTLRIELDSGEVESRFVSLIEENGKPLCADSEGGTPGRSQEWNFSSPLRSIEITAQGSTEPQRLDDFSGREKFIWQDNNEALLPRWSLDIHNRRRSARLVFRPIDVRGVRFTVRFQTALSRLESEDGF